MTIRTRSSLRRLKLRHVRLPAAAAARASIPLAISSVLLIAPEPRPARDRGEELAHRVGARRSRASSTATCGSTRRSSSSSATAILAPPGPADARGAAARALGRPLPAAFLRDSAATAARAARRSASTGRRAGASPAPRPGRAAGAARSTQAFDAAPATAASRSTASPVAADGQRAGGRARGADPRRAGREPAMVVEALVRLPPARGGLRARGARRRRRLPDRPRRRAPLVGGRARPACSAPWPRSNAGARLRPAAAEPDGRSTSSRTASTARPRCSAGQPGGGERLGRGGAEAGGRRPSSASPHGARRRCSPSLLLVVLAVLFAFCAARWLEPADPAPGRDQPRDRRRQLRRARRDRRPGRRARRPGRRLQPDERPRRGLRRSSSAGRAGEPRAVHRLDPRLRGGDRRQGPLHPRPLRARRRALSRTIAAPARPDRGDPAQASGSAPCSTTSARSASRTASSRRAACSPPRSSSR